MSDDDYKLSPEAQAAVDAIVARGDKCAGCGDTEFTHWVQPDGNFCIDCVVARSYEVPALRAKIAISDIPITGQREQECGCIYYYENGECVRTHSASHDEMNRRRLRIAKLEAVLREARRALKFAETILPGGDPMWILEESNANLVLRKSCVPMAIRTIDAALSPAQPTPDLGTASIVGQLREIITDQENDEGLWYDADCAPEAYLQHALRDLHGVVKRAIEGLSPGLPADAVEWACPECHSDNMVCECDGVHITETMPSSVTNRCVEAVCMNCRWSGEFPAAPAQPATAAKQETKMVMCSHGINHSGERHGCDGCCKAAPPSTAATGELSFTREEHDKFMAAVDKLPVEEDDDSSSNRNVGVRSVVYAWDANKGECAHSLHANECLECLIAALDASREGK